MRVFETATEQINLHILVLHVFVKQLLFNQFFQELNKVWLEKINLIPVNEFHIIGGVGYGKVYKIKMQTELTELAVKIVQGVGTLSDYEAQFARWKKIHNCY